MSAIYICYCMSRNDYEVSNCALLPATVCAFIAGVYAFGFLFMLPQLYINYMVIYTELSSLMLMIE